MEAVLIMTAYYVEKKVINAKIKVFVFQKHFGNVCKIFTISFLSGTIDLKKSYVFITIN